MRDLVHPRRLLQLCIGGAHRTSCLDLGDEHRCGAADVACLPLERGDHRQTLLGALLRQQRVSSGSQQLSRGTGLRSFDKPRDQGPEPQDVRVLGVVIGQAATEQLSGIGIGECRDLDDGIEETIGRRRQVLALPADQPAYQPGEGRFPQLVTPTAEQLVGKGGIIHPVEDHGCSVREILAKLSERLEPEAITEVAREFENRQRGIPADHTDHLLQEVVRFVEPGRVHVKGRSAVCQPPLELTKQGAATAPALTQKQRVEPQADCSLGDETVLPRG